MREDDFWTSAPVWDPIFETNTTNERLDTDLLERLRVGPVDEHTDVEAAVALALFVHDEYMKFGTDGSQRVSDEQARLMLRVLMAILKRIGVTDVDIPFRDFTSFHTYWQRKGASGNGGWAARCALLADAFDGLHDRLGEMEAASLASTLAQPVSPRSTLGWPRVDAEIAELTRHFRIAKTEQDYRNVGNDCVAVTEALAKLVYDPEVHVREGEEPLATNMTKLRLDRYVDDALVGADSAPLRKAAKAVIELAQVVKHRGAPTRRDAGIAADAVILLANMLRRIGEEHAPPEPSTFADAIAGL